MGGCQSGDGSVGLEDLLSSGHETSRLQISGLPEALR